MVKEGHELAAVYENRSVAEQNSLVLAWDILMEEEFIPLRTAICANDEELCHFRQLLVNGVMATDIVDKDLKTLRNARWEKAFTKTDSEATASVQDQGRDSVNRKATIVIEHLLQAADVSHTMQ